MKKQLSFFILVFAICHVGFSQAKSVFVELGGPGLASVNFDSRFLKKEDGIGGRIGIGYFKVDDQSLTTVPFGLNYLLSKNQRNYFEVGAGVTYVHLSTNDFIDPSDKEIFDGTFGHLHFGYRLQPKEGGFMFRAGITPIFGNGTFIPYYFSLAFGYKF